MSPPMIAPTLEGRWRTRDAARDEAIAAIALALEDAGGPTPVVPGAEIEVLGVTLRPSSAA